MLQFPTVSVAKTSKLSGFSMDLIHQDSFESPFYDSSVNQSELVERAIFRSSSRLSHLKSLLKLPNNDALLQLHNNAGKEIYSTEATIMASKGEFLMEFSIGTPPVKQWAIFAIGSNVVWTQCRKCINWFNCFKQTKSIFNLKKSSSYRPILCESLTCEQLGPKINCRGAKTKCKYHLEYEDNTISFGELATETFKLGNTSLPGMVFGCSNNNVGVFQKTSVGIVGLGNGPHSLVSQLQHRNGMGGRFSYCLTDKKERSKVSFGANAILSSEGSISTPLILSVPGDYYFVSLEAISVNNRGFPFMIGYRKKGNIMIDSGSTLSFLPKDMYQQLENILKNEIQDTPIPLPTSPHLQLCYKYRDNFEFPTIMFHFSGGADLALQMRNTIFTYGDHMCLAIAPTSDPLALFGNKLQSETMIGFDIDNGRVSFTPNYC
ncbi:aspartic proteinase CDR1-like [Impatiens glandulifera]|uniref:aspartic proteinase CDR1-like n=1 Tax=Impatiens glandulifera TaxID=253017 RepID=UPI001FB14BD1|nr:aspartic proteinase CDR1-like [Impatiens glandulifera]